MIKKQIIKGADKSFLEKVRAFSEKNVGTIYFDDLEDLKTDKRIMFDDELTQKFNFNSKIKHRVIKGDNFYALKFLIEETDEKYDVVYIDPPYNTRNIQTYNDSFEVKKESYEYSTWTSFFIPRIFLAKKLMTDDGKIFISIDKNEVSRVVKIVYELFGEANVYIRKTSKNISGYNYISEFLVTNTKFENTLDIPKESRNILDKTQIMFKYPKPLAFISKILSSSCTGGNEKILDFYGGSATTLHATMYLNKKNGYNLKCTLITNNENNIFYDSTLKRLENIVKDYKDEHFNLKDNIEFLNIEEV